MVKDTPLKNMIIGITAAVSVVLFWSGWVVISRLGVTNNLTVYDIACFRFGFGAIVTLPYVIWRKTWRGLTLFRVLVLTLTAGIPYALLSYFGFVYAPAAHGGVFMNGSLPIFTTVCGWIWLREKSRLSQIAGLGIILIGVILVGYEGFASSSDGSTLLGDFLFLLAIALFAVFMIANRAWAITPGQVLFSVTIVSAVIYVPTWVFWLDSNLANSSKAEILLQGFYQGLVPSALGISFLSIAIRHLGANETSIFISTVPVLAALVAIPILDEIPSLLAWVGMIMVTIGILLAIGVIGGNQTPPPADNHQG